jgi:dihydrofolate synthase/folylpolyglutamate synthase
MLSSVDLINRFPKNIGLGLRPAYWDLLKKLGNPQDKLPPVFHVAGTNGKGSTCAFLRSILEAAGYDVHVYTSPHLVDYTERIRLTGQLIEEKYFAELLARCETLSVPGEITVFEALTAAALTAFAETPADFTILEVGLGGRLDATNVVYHPLASIITRLSYDHRQHLGNTLDAIAREKAGIMRPHIPCFTVAQPDDEVLAALRDVAQEKQSPLSIGGIDWRVTPRENGFHFLDATRAFDLPAPALLGAHQYENAGLAIAALSVLKNKISETHSAYGLLNVEWPARLQKLISGSLADLLPTGWGLWLDGGHNDSAGQVLAQQAAAWKQKDGPRPRPLFLICGMLTTKNVQEFLSPLAPFVTEMRTIAIPEEGLSFSASALAAEAKNASFTNVLAAESITEAIQSLVSLQAPSARILICGSLYLAGKVLSENK